MNLQEKYKKQIIPKMKEAFGYKNDLAVPKILFVKLNTGLSSVHEKDEKNRKSIIGTLERITGQKPILQKAKKSISAFKVRKGMIVGASVTLRGKRMYDFVDKLVNITLARVRDFRGLNPKSMGNSSSLTIGFEEHVAFPEVKPDEVDRIHGMAITIVTNAKKSKEALELFKLMGFPFKEKDEDDE